MPRDTLYLLRFSPGEQRYTLARGELALAPEVTTSREVWECWLETVSSFAFENRAGQHCTVRKERLRRGDVYWYAYRSIEGRTRKRYLGRTADLSFERLEEVSELFAARGDSTAAAEREAGAAVQLAMERVPDAGLVPLLETKLHPPQLAAELVEREWLLARLDAGFMRKLCLLLAPAGSGKTTLARQWLVARRPALALGWVSLDAGDNDPLRFWRYVLTACQALLEAEQRAMGRAVLARFAVPRHSPFAPPMIDLALTEMLNLLAGSSCGGLLVLDDYHAISEPRIHEVLAFFIEHLPATVQTLLLSRAEPPLPLLRWRARGEVSELHAADLRFSREEMATFMRQQLPVALSETALAQLDTSLEGWAAGLRLLSLALSGWRTAREIEQALLTLGEHTGSSPQRSLLDYFVTEILETQPEPVQHFLLCTNFLSRLSGSLCDAVTGGEYSAERLETLQKAGLFLEALEGPGDWYRYHALFAEAMRREASRRLDEEVLRTISQRASSWYERANLLPEAIDAALLAGDIEQVARLTDLLDERGDFYEQQTMLRWLEQIPEALLATYPILCLIYATELRFPIELRTTQMAVSAFEIFEASRAEQEHIEKLLRMAEEGWRRQGELAWVGTVQAFRALSGLIYLEPFSSIVTAARQGLSFLPRQSTDRRLRMYRSTCLLFVGTEELRLGHVHAAQQLLIEAQEANTPSGSNYLDLGIRQMLGKSYLLCGELRRAEQFYCQLLGDVMAVKDGDMTADCLLELAWLAFEWNDLARAEQYTREAAGLPPDRDFQRQDVHERVGLQFALLQYARGETATALEQLTTLLITSEGTWTPGSFWIRARLCSWQGRLWIMAGEFQRVQDSLQEHSSEREVEAFTDKLEDEILHGRLLLALARDQEALLHFTRLLLHAQEHLHIYHVLEIQLLLALACSACQQEQQARIWLRQTLRQAESEGLLRLFLNEGKPLITLLRALLPSLRDDSRARVYAQKILRATAQKASTLSQSPSTAKDQLFESLSAQEKRVLHRVAAGWSNQEIARELVVSVNTVKYHLKNIYQKLGVSNRLQASELLRQ
ncbi:MAG TPA: LuxR C-terminal-related transcriptional regulator [Ktedonobacteraceae bacterium]|nr:LuxR C-terminal-related transcriptional regulator [Ktedonobacteraceae bacterium]